MDSDDWATSGVSFNPYQCFLASLEVGPRVTRGERASDDNSVFNPLFTVVPVTDRDPSRGTDGQAAEN